MPPGGALPSSNFARIVPIVTSNAYGGPQGGLPDQNALHTGRAIFTDAYALIPRGVMRDIVTSRLPGWRATRAWIIARPLSGFAETFSQYIMEVSPGGGSQAPEPDSAAEGAIFVTEGVFDLTIEGTVHRMEPGGFAYVPPGTSWQVRNDGAEPAQFHWIRKRWQPAAGISMPEPVVRHERDLTPSATANSDGRWAAMSFIDTNDMRHDMHINIVSFEPGAGIPFEETHVMEHGLYVLEGKGLYKLNRDWVEVEAGDFMWLRAFCPQACYASGPGRFRSLLYKDMNRHVPLPGPL